MKLNCKASIQPILRYLLSAKAKSMGLKLRIEVANSVDELIRKLLAGEGDMIAYNLPLSVYQWLLYCFRLRVR